MANVRELEVIAGYHPSGESVVERLRVVPVPAAEILTPQQLEASQGQSDELFKLVQAPAFTQGVASGDVIRICDPAEAAMEVVQRSGNLTIQIMGRADLAVLAQSLTGEIEKLGGCLDIAAPAEEPRLLVYSVHVSNGFQVLENLMQASLANIEATWRYGNVYDPKDGQTPLNWWQAFWDPR